MGDDARLPLRLLRRGLKAASRAGEAVVERLLRNESDLGPVPAVPARGASRARTGPARVRFGDVLVEVPRGTTLLDAADSARLELRHYCGGNCSCGTCRVEVLAGGGALSRAQPMELLVLGGEAAARGDRLACQAEVQGDDVQVRIPAWF
jgi:2Fe-2S ferredoxin